MFGRTNVIKSVAKNPLFDYIGDGSDGDIVVASGETYTIDVIECAESAVLNCKSLTVEAGGVLTVSHRCQGLFLKVQNDCVINGTINMDKKSPHLVCVNEDDLAANPCITLFGSPVGGNGGAGGTSCYYQYSGRDTANSIAGGGAGGTGTVFGGGLGGGGGGNTSGGAGNRPPVGTQWPYPGTNAAGMYGAGGGASGANGGKAPGGSGGVAYGSTKAGAAGDAYGGGAIYILVGGNLTLGSSSRLTAWGGNGAASGNYMSNGYRCPGAGGGGGGGLVRIVYGKSYTNNGVTITVGGGNGGKGTTVSSAVSSTLLNWSTGKNGTTGDSKVYTFDELLPKD